MELTVRFSNMNTTVQPFENVEDLAKMGIDLKKFKKIVSASVLAKSTRVVKIKTNCSSRFCANLEFTQLNQHTFYITDLHFLGSGNQKPDIFVVNSTNMSILHD